MKVVILAGGQGTRLTEETDLRPKPMVEIGGRPILWHIMKIYAHYGFKEFYIALGYKGEAIKRYMVEYASLHSDLTVGLRDGRVIARNLEPERFIGQVLNSGWTADAPEQTHPPPGRVTASAPVPRRGTASRARWPPS